MATWAHVWPAWEVEQFVLVGDCGLVLQVPHQCVDEVGVFDDNGHLLEHMLEANVSLLQAGEWGKEEEKLQFAFTVKIKII